MHQAISFQTTQDAGHARFENARMTGELMTLKLALLAQYPDNPPLLFRQVVLVQRRPEECHGGFAGFQQGQGQ
jgi:hypothetical protein